MIPAFVAKRSVRKVCCSIFSRGLIGWAVAVPIAIWLGLADHLRLAATIAALGGVAAGVSLGAAIIERNLR